MGRNLCPSPAAKTTAFKAFTVLKIIIEELKALLSPSRLDLK